MASLLKKIGGTKNENRQKDSQANPESESQTEESGNRQSLATGAGAEEARRFAIATCQHKHTRRRVIFHLVADRGRIAVDLDAAAEAFDECLLCGWWEAVAAAEAVESKSG